MFENFPVPVIFARRGDLAHAPENTLPAFEQAVQKGADGIELDAGAVADLPLRIEIDPVALKSPSSEIMFHIESEISPDISIMEHARFLGPVMR